MGKMKQVDRLADAAYDFAEAYQAVHQATVAAMPYEFTMKLRWRADAALEALKEEAMAHFNNTFDGATE